MRLPWRRRPAGGSDDDPFAPFARDYPWTAGFLAGNLYWDDNIQRAVEELVSELPAEALERTIAELERVIERIDLLWPAVIDWGNRTYDNAADTKSWLERVLVPLKAVQSGARR